MTKSPVDWKAIAEAWQLQIPEADLEQIAPRLDTLYDVFLPLAKDLQPDQEPAAAFDADLGV